MIILLLTLGQKFPNPLRAKCPRMRGAYDRKILVLNNLCACMRIRLLYQEPLELCHQKNAIHTISICFQSWTKFKMGCSKYLNIFEHFYFLFRGKSHIGFRTQCVKMTQTRWLLSPPLLNASFPEFRQNQ